MAGDRISMLRKQRDFVWSEEHWFATLSQALKDVGPQEAAWQPPGGGNTIWQTVNHLNYYNEAILYRIIGRKFEHTASGNTATFGEGSAEDAAGWEATAERTRQLANELSKALDELTDADLDKPNEKGHTLADELPAWVMHDAHHAGQIVLIRKQQGSWPAQRES
ncbi:MAG: hypothetical protein JWN15_3018 [Firmicutes bacterium]|nr:hypothetical protein [Bacillota bacterium]